MRRVICFLVCTFLVALPIDIYAEDFEVCKNCTYKTIDSVFTELEKGNHKDMANIQVQSWDEQKLSNHTIRVPVNIDFSYNALNLDGAGSTITTDKNLSIRGKNLSLKNLNVIYDGEVTNEYESFEVLFFQNTNTAIDNINIKSNKSYQCQSSPIALTAASRNFSIKNSTISSFSIGISSESKLNVDKCNLENNYFSIVEQGEGVLSNSKVGSILSYGLFEMQDNNDFGDLKVSRIDSSTINNISNFCSNTKDKAIYIDSGSYYSSISMKKNITVNLNDASSINSVLSYFKNDVNNKGFEFTSDDEKVASVSNDKVSLLNVGKTSITATNEMTREKYTLNIDVIKPEESAVSDNIKDTSDTPKVEEKLPENPKTGMKNYFPFILIITVLGLFIYKYMKKNGLFKKL